MGNKNLKKNAPSQNNKNAKHQAIEKTVKSSGKSKKVDKKKKPETEDIEDGFDEVDDFGTDEIGEYEEELQAVEEDDAEDQDASAADSGEEVEWNSDVSLSTSVDQEVFLTDAEGNRYCRSRDCDQVANVDAYCRFHYLLFWRRIQNRKLILEHGKLANYVEELTARFPDKFLEMIRKDLRTEKDFLGAIQELEIDEASLDNEMEEDAQSFIDEVRGMGETSGGMDDDEF